ncbi:extracellular solute-binding protein [Nocardia pneumoniae]|uniref:extracellular solute-binding protein n=1 Tax=Nocardia pneumoniae TaxID=228601 RepID=UPI0002E753E0|nr:extracellular solute-binding protein [Nocardia pneumoniae]
MTIYTARPKAIARSVVDAFEAVNPEYRGRVRILTLGASEVVHRVRAETHRPQADVWWGGTSQQFAQGVRAGVLTAARQDVAARVPQQYRGPDDLWLAEMRTAEIIFYNSMMLTADQAPKDWNDLITPDMQGRLLIRDVAASGTMRSVIAALIARSGDPEDGYAYLRALDRNTKDYVANPSDLYLRIQRQEAPVSIWNLQDVLIQRGMGAPLTVVMPASGAPMLPDGVGKIKDGPHGAAADVFMDFLLRPDTQQMLSDSFFQLSTVALPREPAWLTEMRLREMPVDWTRVSREEAGWVDYWVQNIKNRG